MSDGDDLTRLEAELGECDQDFMPWADRALRLGYCPAFVPVSLDGDPTLCLGAWMPFEFAASQLSGERAVAAIIFCHWARQEAVKLGATVE